VRNSADKREALFRNSILRKSQAIAFKDWDLKKEICRLKF